MRRKSSREGVLRLLILLVEIVVEVGEASGRWEGRIHGLEKRLFYATMANWRDGEEADG